MTGSALQPGDTLKVTLPNMSFSSTVVHNTPELFAWTGSIPGIFTGLHSFKFMPSEKEEGYTTFANCEEFSGLLSFLVGENWSMGKDTKSKFEEFNEELKRRVESV